MVAEGKSIIAPDGVLDDLPDWVTNTEDTSDTPDTPDVIEDNYNE